MRTAACVAPGHADCTRRRVRISLLCQTDLSPEASLISSSALNKIDIYHKSPAFTLHNKHTKRHSSGNLRFYTVTVLSLQFNEWQTDFFFSFEYVWCVHVSFTQGGQGYLAVRSLKSKWHRRDYCANLYLLLKKKKETAQEQYSRNLSSSAPNIVKFVLVRINKNWVFIDVSQAEFDCTNTLRVVSSAVDGLFFLF